jgi:chromatin segregation and condensation protein Rec8/ScpA/Scc1 (kleisin family)
MNTLLIVFIVVTALAVVIQAGILAGMYVAMRKTSGKVELLAEEVRTKVLPAAQLAQELITELRPKLVTVADNVSASTTVMRNQLERLDATLTDIVDRTRLQVIRADEFVNNTMDKLEETRDAVQRTVVSPVRQLSGIMHGLSVGFEAFLGRRREQNASTVPQDEMFI